LTADPDISAIGDCALFESPRFGGSLRLESVQNATDHARCVAARLTGDDKSYDGQPWFWSDQGDDKLQIAGLTTGYDQVVLRGNPAQKAFSAFCYKAGKLVGIESVNRAGDHMFGRRFLPMGRQLPPEQAADPSFDLKAALA
jgi:3-phenylpropionate/trans-cinnamate dioxygenase ferredoxin reductase subunit